VCLSFFCKPVLDKSGYFYTLGNKVLLNRLPEVVDNIAVYNSELDVKRCKPVKSSKIVLGLIIEVHTVEGEYRRFKVVEVGYGKGKYKIVPCEIS
jgi:hypothetical protein